MAMWQHACIGLGSNLNNPIEQVRRALDELAAEPHCELVAHSQLYRSAPVGPQDQPDFINAVAVIRTCLAPHDLLDRLQALEMGHQRVRKRHWGERTLDLDLLLYGHAIIRTPRLTVPHPFMWERGFVVYPLSEVINHLEQPQDYPLAECLNRIPFDLEAVENDN